MPFKCLQSEGRNADISENKERSKEEAAQCFLILNRAGQRGMPHGIKLGGDTRQTCHQVKPGIGVVVHLQSHVRIFATPWTVARQTSLEFVQTHIH